MHSVIEQRRARRYQLSVPAYFLWSHHGGKPQSGQGVTRDINNFGVYVLTDGLPQVGARVQVEILLPKVADTGLGMRLTGEGVVLRVKTRGANADDVAECGFAASAQFNFESLESALLPAKISEQVA